MERRPNFFIVGAIKSGTSSLYAYLKNIPGIYMSPVKEPNYFSVYTIPDNHRVNPIRQQQRYLKLFSKVKDEKIIGEASPNYLTDPQAPELIHKVSPNAKILISLRDPIERLFSYYLMIARLGDTHKSFQQEVLEAMKLDDPKKSQLGLRGGLYYDCVKRYYSIFGESQVKIIIFEEFIKTPKDTVASILKFLEINSELTKFDAKVYNEFGIVRGPISQYFMRSKSIRRMSEVLIPPSQRRILKEIFLLKKQEKPNMDDESRKILINYYKDDVSKLRYLLRSQEIKWRNFPE